MGLAGEDCDGFGPMRSDAMNEIHYSRTKIGLVILVPGLLLASSLIAPLIGQWDYFFGMLIVNVILSPIVIWGLRFLHDNTAVKIGATSLEVYGIFRSKKIRYDHILRMEIETDDTGYKPTRQLVIDRAYHDGQARISERFLDHKTASLESILDRMEMAASGAGVPASPCQSQSQSPFQSQRRSSHPSTSSAKISGVGARAGGFGRKTI